MKPPERLPQLDALRGVASLAVCWFHLTNGNAAFLPDGWLKNSGLYGWLGTISYSLYLLHTLFGMRVINLGTRLTTTPLTQFGIMLAGLTVSLLAAWMFYLLIIRAAQRWAARIRYSAPRYSGKPFASSVSDLIVTGRK